VIAQDLRSESQFENEENYQKRGKLVGYAVSRRFEVKVGDVARFRALADDPIAIGGVQFSQIEGGLQKAKEPGKSRDQTR
jgi:uncharacterized protein YggE